MSRDSVLGPPIPLEPCDVFARCDRTIEEPDDRSIQRLVLFSTVEDADNRDYSRRITVRVDCRRPLGRLLDNLDIPSHSGDRDPTARPSTCGRRGADGTPDDGVLSSFGPGAGARYWRVRLCPDCRRWFAERLTAVLDEPTPYRDDRYRPPGFRRAEAAVARYEAAATGPVAAASETLGVGDVVRLVAYGAGWGRRGEYL